MGAVYASPATSQAKTNERMGPCVSGRHGPRRVCSLLRLSRPSEPSFAGTFPSWLTEADRRLTVEKALATAGLWNIDGMWDLATSRLDTGAAGDGAVGNLDPHSPVPHSPEADPGSGR